MKAQASLYWSHTKSMDVDEDSVNIKTFHLAFYVVQLNTTARVFNPFIVGKPRWEKC